MLLTGATGFKGSWLAQDLVARGAEVVGLSLPTEPGSLFDRAGVGELLVADLHGDIRNARTVASAFRVARPDLVLHLAAQAFVRPSYAAPLDTWSANVLGTATVLETLRVVAPDCPAVVVTSDKVYADGARAGGNGEDDPLGGTDPYSASKAATELVATSYRSAFGLDLATVRAGNVLGGGDRGTDRLLPDVLHSIDTGNPIVLRSPGAVRPWQHVLDALRGYRMVAERLLNDSDPAVRSAFNFGPVEVSPTVQAVVEHALVRAGREAGSWHLDGVPGPAESAVLQVRSDRAAHLLGWTPRWNWQESVTRTVDWHLAARGAGSEVIRALCSDDLAAHARIDLPLAS